MVLFVGQIDSPTTIEIIAEVLGTQSKFDASIFIIAIPCCSLFIVKVGRVRDFFCVGIGIRTVVHVRIEFVCTDS